MKWAQWDKTQSRELLGLFICVCALHCAQLLHTILHRTDLTVFPLTLQTITTAPMMSIWGKGVAFQHTNTLHKSDNVVYQSYSNHTALITAHICATPRWNSHSVVTNKQWVHVSKWSQLILTIIPVQLQTRTVAQICVKAQQSQWGGTCDKPISKICSSPLSKFNKFFSDPYATHS